MTTDHGQLFLGEFVPPSSRFFATGRFAADFSLPYLHSRPINSSSTCQSTNPSVSREWSLRDKQQAGALEEWL